MTRRAGAGRRRLTAAALVTTGALAAGAAVALVPVPAARPGAADAAHDLPPPMRPAFVPGAPRRLASADHLTHWAPVRRRVRVRRAPDAGAPAVAELLRSTPEGTANLVVVVDRRLDRTGAPWVRVQLPVLPNGTRGWVPRGSLGGYSTVDTELRIELDRLRATLLRRGRVVLRAPIGVGRAAAPTPRGSFYVRSKLTRYASPVYGPVAFGTSARSETLTDWPGGGFVGIHGTDRPDLVPGRVSHGCIRLRNEDVLALARRMPVGTPVTIS